MKHRFALSRLLSAAALFALGVGEARATEEVFERIEDALRVNTPDGFFRARLSGMADLEGYHLPTPAPDLINTKRDDLFNPRLTVFLDAQVGSTIYLFAQARADHGFDPGDSSSRQRMDEYALRYTPWRDGRVSVQVGKFATIVGNWVGRHTSWENPFVDAPLPYENLTGIWDTEAVKTATILRQWGHVIPGLSPATAAIEKKLRVPVIWGPSYATGASVSGALGKLRYSAELKNSPLSSRPTSWTKATKWWTYPSVAARLGYAPSAAWNLGVSAATSSYLKPSATPTVSPGFGRGDYRQETLATDASFAWHYWQVWAELYRTRFEIPRVGNADTLAGYIEAKYKLTPQLFGAVRWNRQVYGTLPDPVRGDVRWGLDTWRIDLAAGYRFTTHIQLKLQYSLREEPGAAASRTDLLATQLTVRF